MYDILNQLLIYVDYLTRMLNKKWKIGYNKGIHDQPSESETSK